ncbi:hypothetical protein DFP93_101254 [Aneurinibacillus soli]|uniref:Uncharacterized protein n=1 Tax=Aneurinibacillus soli TaxID=1500254 RepID=A0A0U5AWR0_9BACL|nr:hypothetical protein [Aneurinibacillus soli]PYE64228.1 hypothetical protein DFP93_101254 [Aneurinibacillus soli]BAU28177.1 hypothetical protein CB4_02351 [Aneurinibacillus soli]
MATFNGLILDENGEDLLLASPPPSRTLAEGILIEEDNEDDILLASSPPARIFTGGLLIEENTCENMYKPPRQFPLEISWTKGSD